MFFGRNGIRFECRGSSFEEHHLSNFTQQNPEVFLPLPATQSSEWDTVEKVRDKWYNMVTEYVQRYLAFESDRLIALAGVAEKFGGLLGLQDEYLTGLWKNDLCHGLCWRFWAGNPWGVLDAEAFSKSSSFPSWSWSCMKRPITWSDGTGSIPCAQLVEAVKSLDKSQAAVQGETVKLVLEAWTFRADILSHDVPLALEMHVRLDAEEEPTEDMSVLNGYTAVVLSAYLEQGDERDWKTSCTTMVHEVYGLIVSETGSQHKGIEEYSRMGIFEVRCDVGAEFGEDEMSRAESFYQQIYATRGVLALI